MRLLHVSDGVMSWDGYDDLSVATLPVEFRIPDIEINTGIGQDSRDYGRLFLFKLKRKKPESSLKSSDVGTISIMGHRRLKGHLCSSIISIEHRLHRGEPIIPLPPAPPQPAPPDTEQIFIMPTIRGHTSTPRRDFIGYTSDQQIPRPFRLTPNRIPKQPSVSPVYLQHVPPMTPFILFPRARISIWSLLASSSTHRDALVKALSQIRIDTSTTPEGLIHILTADRATCIVFSDDNLPPEGSDHVHPLYISVACSGHRVPSVLLDNDSALNVCPLATSIALGFSPSDFGPSTQTILRAILGFEDPSSFNLLLDRPWIHEASVIPSSLHQKISHSDDDLHLTGPHEFAFIINHDTPYGLGYTPTEEDARHMVRLRMDRMDMIGIGHILDTAPHRPHSAFDLFGVSMLELDGDDSITDRRSCGPTSLSFNSMFGFVTCYDVMFDGNNNDMTIFEHLPAPTTQIHDIDDMGNPDGPLSGQSDCDSDSEERKVTPISGSTESVDFGTSNQPKELKIGSSLSLDERSRLINLLRSYLYVFVWSYDDMPCLDPFIVQHHRSLCHILDLKEEIQKQLSVGFLSVVEYPEWLANVVPVPKKDGKVRVWHSMLSFMDGFSGYNQILMALEDMEKTSFIIEWGTYCYKHGIEVDSEKIIAILDMPAWDRERDKRLSRCLEIGRKASFALWAYHTSFRTSTMATLFSLVYDMEVIPVEIEVGPQITCMLIKGKWSPYVIRELTRERAWLDLDGNRF
ncbi:hypothetical protein AAG906_022651 [Vitis piasezkii]